MTGYEYIQKHYGVPAKYGMEISYKGRKGYIVEDRGHYIGVNFHDEKRTIVHSLHPTDNVEYLEVGKPRKLTRSQIRYKQYINSETSISFGRWLRENFIK